MIGLRSALNRHHDWRKTVLGWCLCWVLALVMACEAMASSKDAGVAISPVSGEAVLEVYVRQGCPHCASAKAYLARAQVMHPNVRVVYRAVDEDKAARDDLLRVSESGGFWPPGVPTFVYRGQVLVGFESDERSGPLLEALLLGQFHPPPQAPAASPQAPSGPESMMTGLPSVQDWGLPLFTLAMGLLDGFNPCAMWVLLFLLSLLVRLQDRRRMAMIAGTFVLVSGLVYYAFMAAWLNVFLAVGLSGPVRIGLAVLALMIAAVNLKDGLWGIGQVSLSIPATAKPGVYARMRQVMQAPSMSLAMVAVAGLALAVNFVELLCTAGLPAMYTAVLTQQQLGAGEHYGYLALYILGYIADDSLMVGTAALALSHSKLSEVAGRRLKLISGVVMLILGCVMLFRPEWLV